MTRFAVRGIGAAVLLLGIASSHAGVIYNEAIDGDLGGNDISPFTTISLSEGLNTVLGSFAVGPNVTNDFDNFVFEIPAGFRLHQIYWSATGLVDMSVPEPSGGLFEIFYRLYEGSPTNVGNLIETSSITSSTAAFTSFSFQAEGGSDWVLLGIDKVAANNGGSGTYEVSFDVRRPDTKSIPEPSSLALVVLGFMGLVGRTIAREQCMTSGLKAEL